MLAKNKSLYSLLKKASMRGSQRKVICENRGGQIDSKAYCFADWF